MSPAQEVYQSPILISGGAYSGKSDFAPSLLNHNDSTLVIGTAKTSDQILCRRVLTLQSKRPKPWTTSETDIHLVQELAKARGQYSQVLVDSLNLWVGAMLAHGLEQLALAALEDKVLTHFRNLSHLIETWPESDKLILVSREGGSGPAPVSGLERLFRQLMGRLNCIVAKQSHTVIHLSHGIPSFLKGGLETTTTAKSS